MTEREELAKLIHEEWETWAKSIFPELQELVKDHVPIDHPEAICSCKTCQRIERWREMFIPYEELPEPIKDYDRIWADKVIAMSQPYLDQQVKEVFTEGALLIARERNRQIEVEGWHSTHDNQEHFMDDLAEAGAYYAMPAEMREQHDIWPWDTKWVKPVPNDRIRELVKAGALIAAEIDREIRVSSQEA